MWKDQGVSGDGQRIEQLVWMLFLKIFDDQEKGYELENDKYISPIPEKFRWRTWASNKEGITGEELIDFVNRELFPTLKNIKADTRNKRALIVKEVFEDAYNYMKSGTLLRQVVNTLNEIDFNKKDDRHLLNDIYEKILKDLQGAGNYGEFYTPRPLTKFIIEMVDPKLGEKVLDPACGTGGFLVNTIEYVRHNYVKKTQDEKILHESISGTELKPLPHLLSITNLILHGIEVPDQIHRGDMLSQPLINYGPKDRVDIIVANPPFGGAVKDGTENNFPSKFKTKSTAELFLVLFIHLLKPTGRVGIVLPDGSLFGDGVIAKIREHLLTECNVHTIVRLPPGVFSPYAGVNTNLIFFEKGKPTKEVWYYEMRLPAGLKQYTKGSPIQDKDFDPVKVWWKKRVQNESAWKVSIKDIEAKNWNLDFKNPHIVEGEKELSSKEFVKKILKSEEEIKNIISNL
ncbi:MAG: type restriction enzyme protein [Patescibacteria group bacterium]|nr:type restriction enzyme protein [Patescibacteria group bacterium]